MIFTVHMVDFAQYPGVEPFTVPVEQLDLFTIPDYMPDEFETDVFCSPRVKTDRHFWEELQFRNALKNHFHASIPGHRFDSEIRKRLDNSIRRTHGESARIVWEGVIGKPFPGGE